jgi:hypothetical protein
LQRGGQFGQRVFVRQIQPARVAAVRAVQRRWQRNARVGQASGAFLGGLLIHHLHGALHQLVQRNGFVGNAVHERGVGAVFQQAAHQVGQQGFVRAHGGVDAARAAQAALSCLSASLPAVMAPTTCSYSGSPMPCRHWNSYCPA